MSFKILFKYKADFGGGSENWLRLIQALEFWLIVNSLIFGYTFLSLGIICFSGLKFTFKVN